MLKSKRNAQSTLIISIWYSQRLSCHDKLDARERLIKHAINWPHQDRFIADITYRIHYTGWFYQAIRTKCDMYWLTFALFKNGSVFNVQCDVYEWVSHVLSNESFIATLKELYVLYFRAWNTVVLANGCTNIISCTNLPNSFDVIFTYKCNSCNLITFLPHDPIDMARWTNRSARGHNAI